MEPIFYAEFKECPVWLPVYFLLLSKKNEMAEAAVTKRHIQNMGPNLRNRMYNILL
jgi:hypothetical protein